MLIGILYPHKITNVKAFMTVLIISFYNLMLFVKFSIANQNSIDKRFQYQIPSE